MNMLTVKMMEEKMHVARTSLDRYEKQGLIPKRRKIKGRIYWLEEEVDAALTAIN